jgi:hypothetical protein
MIRALRILYAGDLTKRTASGHRFMAMKRLGHEVLGLDVTDISSMGGPMADALQNRLAAGPGVARLNRTLLKTAMVFVPDIVWFERPVFIWPATLRSVRRIGAALVQYTADNPFGLRSDAGWRLHLKTAGDYDFVFVPRQSGVAAYRAKGARDVRVLGFAYDPTTLFPPPKDWADSNRTMDVSFSGLPYRDRPRFLLALAEHHRIAVHLRGNETQWRRGLTPEQARLLHLKEPVHNDAYREEIWRARISLAMVAHDNLDETSERAFEIAACQGFMLCENTPGCAAYFTPDTEAPLFSTPAECAALIRRYLSDEAARQAIAAAARRRVETSGYSNDARLAEAIAHVSAPRIRVIKHYREAVL